MSIHSFETKCLPCTDAALALAESLLRQGEIIAVPTETVYGLAADATNPKAIEKIYTAKGRPSFNPLIVHVGSRFRSTESLSEKGFLDKSRLSVRAAAKADKLMECFWPGPLTLVLPRGDGVSSMVARGLPTVGFRMPGHPEFLKLLDRSSLVLAAPSANLSNRISPTLAQHVLSELTGRIPLVLDGGACQFGLESTIIEIHQATGMVRLLRQGAIPKESIEDCAGEPVEALEDSSGVILAPGMMRKHYSPTKPLLLVDARDLQGQLEQLRQSGVYGEISILNFSDSPDLGPQQTLQDSFGPLAFLSLSSDDRLVAQSLFQTLRLYDQGPSQVLIIERPEQSLENGLWPAIWDRLTRASSQG